MGTRRHGHWARAREPNVPVRAAIELPSVFGSGDGFGKVDSMTESEPARPEPGAPPSEERVAPPPSSDELAAKLLAVQCVLRGLNADPDVRMKLHLRFMAICTSLKVPKADRVKGAERLDRLVADAELARAAGWHGDQVLRPP